MNRRQRFPRPRDRASSLDDAAVASATAESAHRPLLLREVLRCLQPRARDLVVDATLGGGGHAHALMAHIRPGGRLIGVDVDGPEVERTQGRLRAAGFGPDVFHAYRASFAELPSVLAREGVAVVDLILVDLGLSSMQVADPARGFGTARDEPLDLRFDTSTGDTAAALIARLDRPALADLLRANADEPHADAIAASLKHGSVASSRALDRAVRVALAEVLPGHPPARAKLGVRRAVQALRIAVNDELTALDRLLDALPACLAPGGRVAIVTFHSGEDRRVKRAFRAGHRQGLYAAVARETIRSTTEETRADRRAMAAKLRWAVRSRPRPR